MSNSYLSALHNELFSIKQSLADAADREKSLVQKDLKEKAASTRVDLEARVVAITKEVASASGQAIETAVSKTAAKASTPSKTSKK